MYQYFCVLFHFELKSSIVELEYIVIKVYISNRYNLANISLYQFDVEPPFVMMIQQKTNKR